MRVAAQICIACDQAFLTPSLARHCSPGCVSRARGRRAWLEARNVALKAKATRRYRLALRNGQLTRPMFCDACRGAGVIHGHHEDYAKPLAVTWLCARCHLARHLGREDETLEFAM
jgi:hypothetical protein